MYSKINRSSHQFNSILFKFILQPLQTVRHIAVNLHGRRGQPITPSADLRRGPFELGHVRPIPVAGISRDHRGIQIGQILQTVQRAQVTTRRDGTVQGFLAAAGVQISRVGSPKVGQKVQRTPEILLEGGTQVEGLVEKLNFGHFV